LYDPSPGGSGPGGRWTRGDESEKRGARRVAQNLPGVFPEEENGRPRLDSPRPGEAAGVGAQASGDRQTQIDREARIDEARIDREARIDEARCGPQEKSDRSEATARGRGEQASRRQVDEEGPDVRGGRDGNEIHFLPRNRSKVVRGARALLGRALA